MRNPSILRRALRPVFEIRRFVILGTIAPQALYIFLLTALFWPLGARCRKVENPASHIVREKSVISAEHIGWVKGSRIFRLGWKKQKIIDFTIHDEKSLHILNFYFFRKARFILKELRKFSAQGADVELFEGMRVFEPGCNMGRMLFLFGDLYNAHITGVDIYVPAIEMVKHIQKRGDDFRIENILQSEWLRGLPDNYFDLMVASSFINHISHLPESYDFMKEILRVSSQIYIHDRTLDNPEILSPLKGEDSDCKIIEKSGRISFFVKKCKADHVTASKDLKAQKYG